MMKKTNFDCKSFKLLLRECLVLKEIEANKTQCKENTNVKKKCVLRLVIKDSYCEKLIERTSREVEEERERKGIMVKSLFEQSVSSYFSGNYHLAFIGAYLYLIKPIAINSKRLHKIKNKKKFTETVDAFSFNLVDALKESVFLDGFLKSELSQSYEVSLKFPKKTKRYNLNLSQIRNITFHPEDYRHKFLLEQLNYKKFALQMLYLARQVHTQYNKYLLSPDKEERKRKEKELYHKYCIVSSL